MRWLWRVTTSARGSRKPHLLVLSDDQIHADKIPAPMTPLIREIADELVGTTEARYPATPIGGRQKKGETFRLTSSVAADNLRTFGQFLGHLPPGPVDHRGRDCADVGGHRRPVDPQALDRAGYEKLLGRVETYRKDWPIDAAISFGVHHHGPRRPRGHRRPEPQVRLGQACAAGGVEPTRTHGGS